MFGKLKAFVGDNAEALELIKSLEATATNNIDRINTLERQVTDISATRDKFKTGNTLVKSLLGLETVNEDTLSGAVSKLKDNTGDETLSAEIVNLKDLLAKSTDENKSLSDIYEGRISTMALDNEIANSGIGANVVNEAMFGIMTGLIKQGASYDEGKIVYKHSDGSTVYGADKQPLTLSGKLEALKTDPDYAGLFKPSIQGGSGSPSTTVESGRVFKDMNEAERNALYRKDPEAYRRAAKQ